MKKNANTGLAHVLVGLVFGWLSATSAFAAADVTAGSASASADTAAAAPAPGFTTVTTITIAESANATFAQNSTTYTFTFTAPSGWNFDLSGAAPSVTKNVGGSDIGTPSINRIDSTTITVVFTTDAAQGNKDTLYISGIRVQPLNGLGLGTNYITVTSSGTITGGFSTTNVAALIKTAGAVNRLTFGVQPGDRSAATVFTPAITVRIEDQFGNLTANNSSVVMAIANNPGGGTLSGTRTNAAVAGTATFNNLSIDKSGSGYTLLAQSGALPDTNSVPFNITNGSPTKLVITTAPQTLTAGMSSAVITVELQDAGGNPTLTPTNRTITLTRSSAGGVFRDASDTVNITNVILSAGTSAASYRYLDTAAGNPTITNAAVGLISALQTETVLPTAATQIRVETLASGAGVVVPTQNITAGNTTNLFAIFRDQFGNFVTNDVASWSLINLTGGVVSNDLVVAGNSNSATFTGHLLGSAVVQATSPGMSNTLSGTLTVVGGVPNKLVITTAPQTLTAGVSSAVITVQIQDAEGNRTSATANRVITLTSSSAGAIFRNVTDTATITTITIATGQNSTNYLYRALLAGSATITNTTPTLTNAATQTEIVLAAAASKLVVTTQPSTTASAGIAFAVQPTVKVQDAFGNTVETFGSPVTVSQTTGGSLNASLTSPSVIPIAGVADFNGLFITNAGTTTLTFTAPGVTATNSSIINVLAGVATRIRVETLANGAGTVVPTQNVISGLTVTNYAIARDLYGNFATNAPASSWSLVNVNGGVMSADLLPAADNKSAVFTGRLLGSANVHVTSGVLPATDSGTLTVLQGTNDPDLPGASATFKIIPAGSWVIAMDNANQSLVAPFNLKAYGLVNRLLQNYVPVSWAIRAGKTKDGVDFSAPAFRIAPTTNGVTNLNFAGGPFIIHRDYTNLASPHITAFGNNVAVYQLTSDTVVDIRHELQFLPSISVNSVNASIHTNLLHFAGITNYTVTSDYNLSSNTCFTLFLEPHNGSTNGVASARNFIQSGGNFLAECLAVATYENAAAGHFQSTSNLVTANIGNTLAYVNADLPYSQFVGIVDPTPGGSHQDWTMGGGSFKNNGHVHLDDIGVSPAHYAATSSKHSIGPGGLLFYLGGHDFGAGGTDLTLINGQRMILNAIFVPANRPTCGVDFSADLSITMSDSVQTVTNGQSVTYIITVANQGFNQVNGATVTNLVGPSLTNVTWTSTTTGGATNFNPSGAGNILASVNLPVYGTVIFTVQATIASGATCLVTNIATVSPPANLFEININNNVAVDVDHVVPAFIAPPDLLLSCASQIPAAATNVNEFLAAGGTIGNSEVPTTLTIQGDASNGGAGCPSSPLIISRTYRLTTACGDFVEQIQTLTVIDQTPPVIQCAGNKTVAAGSVWSFDTPAASDGCSIATISVLSTVTNGLCGEGFIATRTWQASDACGNVSVCSQTVTVEDTSAPTIICVANKTVECGSVWTFDAPNAGAHLVTILNTTTNAACGNTFTATRTWQAVNACGTFSQCSQTVTVVDTHPPVITCSTNKTVELGAPWTFDQPTAIDDCGTNVIVVVSTITNTASFCGDTFAVTRTWSTTDACGNSTQCSQTVTVLDTTPPTLTCSTNLILSVDAGQCSRSNVTFAITATDNCSISNLISLPPSGSTFPVGTTIVTNIAVDLSGNSNTCVFTVTIIDDELPLITCPTNITVIADLASCFATGVVLGVPITSDNCGVASVSSNAPGSFPVGTNVVTWTVTDIHGNTATCEQLVIVLDTQPPLITCPTNITVIADLGSCFATGVVLGTPITSDNCGVASVSSNAPINFPAGTNVVTWTVTDIHGNTATCEQKVIVLDTQSPIIACPATVTVIADLGVCFATGVVLGVPITSDNCGVASVSSNAPSSFPAGTNVVTWTVTDIHGNTATCEQKVIVLDTQSPVITCPATVTVTADLDSCFATGVVLGVPITSDNCGVATVINNAPVNFPVGTNTVTWTVTDIHGNTATCEQKVIVKDTQAPTIFCPADVIVSANAGCTATNVALTIPVVGDNCSIASLTTNTPPIYVLGTNLVIWTVTDGSGNTNQCTQLVIVQDTTPPTISCPANITVDAVPGRCSSNVTFMVTSADNCGGVASLVSTPPSGFAFPVGTTTVISTAIDSSGNTNRCTFTVTVIDTQPPSITCPVTVTIAANPGSCFATGVPLGVPITSDNCGVASVSSNAPGSFPVGTNVVTWTVTDMHGNSASCQQLVIVLDTQPPLITCPTNITVIADVGSCFATGVVLGTPITSDNCGVASVSSNAPSSFPAGTNVVTWTVTDIHGNTATCEQKVIVLDTQSPVITCPATVTVTADLDSCFATGVVLGIPITSDNCGVASVSINAPRSFPIGTNLVTWTVTDIHGNSASCQQLVIVRGTQPPAITCPADRTVSANDGCSATNVALGVPVVGANCGGTSVTSNAPSIFPLGTNLVIWTVVDSHGNTNQCTQRVIVRDTTQPTITCPADLTVSANAGCAATNVPLGVPVVGDNCSIASVTSNAPPVFAPGTNLVIWTVTDGSGNTNQCTQRVIVRDTTPPTIFCPANITVNAAAGQCSSNVIFTVTGADNCGSVASLVSTPPSGFAFPVGTTTVTSTAIDGSGNTNRCTFTVTVIDTQPPTITCPANISTNAGPGANTVTNIALGTPIVSDNCTVVSVTNNAPAVFPVGTNTVTWIVTDSAGLTNFCQQKVVVVPSCSGILSVSGLTNLTRCAHDPAIFQVTATSPDPITYTWKFNGLILPGQTNNSIFLGSPETTNGGLYAVEVRTACKAVTNSATLTVQPVPTNSVVVYSNSAAISIPILGAANPYPAILTPQCVPGVVKKITVTLYGFTHTYPSDVNVLLVSPDGRKVMLMAGAGDAVAGGGVNLTFADAGTQPVPYSGTIVSGVYRPSNYDPGVVFGAPAPAGPYSTNLSTFIGADPNGPWKLFVYDDFNGDAGTINRWSLTLEWGTDSPLFLANPRQQTNGTMAMDVWGRTGVPTVILRSPNLINWTPIATNVYGASPALFIDPQATNPHQFYRALQP